jgi:hypothetical protein
VDITTETIEGKQVRVFRRTDRPGFTLYYPTGEVLYMIQTTAEESEDLARATVLALP